MASECGLKCLWKSVSIMTPLLSEIVRGRQKSQNKLGEITLPSLTLVCSNFKHCQSVSLSNLKVIHQNQVLYPSNRTYILMVEVLSSCFLIHSLAMVYWKLKHVHIAAVYTTTIQIVFDSCNICLFFLFVLIFAFLLRVYFPQSHHYTLFSIISILSMNDVSFTSSKF